MIRIQTAWHSTDITKKIEKNNNIKKMILKKISADGKTMENYLVGKKSRWTCRFHAACFQYGTV